MNDILLAHLNDNERREILETDDPVRYGTVLLALEQIEKEQIAGALAECGVYRGTMSQFLHKHAPTRLLYLFDTFEGFDPRDVEGTQDERFRDTSAELVRSAFGSADTIVIRQGYFPESAKGLSEERFAFVMIDFDKYRPILAALDFFYPRMHRGGYVVLHDYNSTESDYGCFRAATEFLASKPERLITIPDKWGSALFRKI